MSLEVERYLRISDRFNMVYSSPFSKFLASLYRALYIIIHPKRDIIKTVNFNYS